MKEIDEVMRLIREDPKQLHIPENIDAIIAFQREWRQKYEAGEKPPSPAGKKSVKELLSIVIKPGPPEKRRA